MEVVDKSEKREHSKMPEKKPPWLIIMLIGSVLLLALVFGVFYMINGSLPLISRLLGEETAENTIPSYIYPLREFQVNLADPGSRRFLRITIDLAYDDRALTKELEERDSEVRSHIIAVLRSKYVVDLDEPGGMEKLEQDLIQRLNSFLEEGEIKAIYYKELIYQ